MRQHSAQKGGNVRRLLRWAFNGTAVLSALLLVATCALWASSHFVRYTSHGPSILVARLDEGDIYAILRRGSLELDIVFNGIWYVQGEIPIRTIAIIFFVAASAFALLRRFLIVIPLKYERESWHIAGICDVCGYDLRATPERCPECGAVPASAKSETSN